MYQVYFSRATEMNLDRHLKPYDNTGKLKYTFENAIIRELVEAGEHKKAEYFGVLSHDYKGEGRCLQGWDNFWKSSPEYEVISFYGFSSQKNIFKQSDNWHPGFFDTFDYIVKKLGHTWHTPLPYFNILRNGWVAREHVWEDYVSNFLAPVMDMMETDSILKAKAWEDSGYSKMKQTNAEELKAQIGVGYYPMAPFILERLPVFFMSKRNYTRIHT